jgi:hypothetical protein
LEIEGGWVGICLIFGIFGTLFRVFGTKNAVFGTKIAEKFASSKKNL